jgi:hypothetical protein
MVALESLPRDRPSDSTSVLRTDPTRQRRSSHKLREAQQSHNNWDISRGEMSGARFIIVVSEERTV